MTAGNPKISIMWQTVARSIGNGSLAIIEYTCKISAFLAGLVAVGIKGSFLEKFSAAFSSIPGVFQHASSAYQQTVETGRVVSEYNRMDLAIFTELYGEGPLNGALGNMNVAAQYLLNVDQNFAIDPAGTASAAILAFLCFFMLGSALRIVRQEGSYFLRFRIKKQLRSFFKIIKAGKEQGVELRESKKKLVAKGETKLQDNHKQITTSSKNGYLELLKIPTVSQPDFDKEGKAASNEKKKQESSGFTENRKTDDPESSGRKSQMEDISYLELKKSDELNIESIEEAANQFSEDHEKQEEKNEKEKANQTKKKSGHDLNKNGSFEEKDNGSNQELEKHTLNEFLEKARSSS